MLRSVDSFLAIAVCWLVGSYFAPALVADVAGWFVGGGPATKWVLPVARVAFHGAMIAWTLYEIGQRSRSRAKSNGSAGVVRAEFADEPVPPPVICSPPSADKNNPYTPPSDVIG